MRAATQYAPVSRGWHWPRPGFREPERYLGYLFVLPALALIILMRIMPLAQGARISLTNWDGIDEPIYIGLQNYQNLMHDPVFRDTAINTFVLLATLPIWVLFPLLLAIFIHLKVPGAGFFRVAYFFPVVLSSVIIGAIFNIFLRYDGNFNEMLSVFGIEAVDWLGDGSTALATVIVVQIWSSFGMGVLIFLSGLATVPQDLIDAAKVAGANLGQVVWYVVIPAMMPIIEFVAVVTTLGMLTSMFGLIYVMTGGGPGTATYLPEFLIWLQQGELNKPGYAAATSMIVFCFVGLLAYIQVRFMTRKVDL